jgi:hypothetical protein
MTPDIFDGLVVDLQALQKVDVVRFAGDVMGQCFDTQQAQDVLWIGWPSTSVSITLKTKRMA